MIGRWTRVRIALMGVLFAGLALWIGRRAYELQVNEADKLREWGEDNYLKEIELPPHRGRILDRNGHELATTVEFDSVYCNPRLLANVPDGAKRLARALGVDARELGERLFGKPRRRYFEWVRRRVPPEDSARALALGLPGVGVRKEPSRVYPYDLAGPVLGHAVDGRGIDGVELAFDQDLRGSAMEVKGIRDALGRELLVDGLVDPSATAGKDVVLTVDKFLTYTTEKALAAAVEKHHAKAGVAIVMDPNTGEILALANVPTYNPGNPKETASALARGARDRAVVDTFEPGSTMKTFTFAAALDAGRLRPTDSFDCQLGKMQVGKYTIRDDHPKGVLSAAEVYKHSSNIGTVKIARRIGREALAEVLAKFGFGRPSGVTLPGEARGIVRPPGQWGEIGFVTRAFGQGLTVTPLQMVAGYAAVAAGGVYHAPRIALRTVASDGQVVDVAARAAGRDERVVSDSAARTMLSIMRGAVDDGTGKAAAIAGYPVGGKTGTAQKVVGGGYDKSKYIGSFIGIVPLDRPRLVIGVFIDEPQPIHYGGVVAAPAFKEIAEAALPYLRVPPSEPIVVQKAKGAGKDTDKDRGSRAGAQDDRALSDVAEGPGTDDPGLASEDALDRAVTAPGDEANDAVAGAEGEDVRPNELVTVPNFSGMTMAEAIQIARRVGLELVPDGSGLGYRQAPSPGTLPRGAICRVSFRPGG